MAPQTQISASVELTKIASAGIIAGRHFINELRNSGSDPYAEEELVLVLGQCQIADAIASSFRGRVVGTPSGFSALVGAIQLVTGLGPTVNSAIRLGLRAPEFSMVVQCTYLSQLYRFVRKVDKERASDTPC